MTIHYSVESLPNLFLSEQFTSEKNEYEQRQFEELNQVRKFLNSIEINKETDSK